MLPFHPLGQNVILALPLHRADRRVDAALCIVATAGNALRPFRHEFLHLGELERVDSMLAGKRIDDFLIGRYACKYAIMQLYPNQIPTELNVVSGVFGQPVLQSVRQLSLQVSISHCAGVGAGLATPDTHPMAIDVERYLESNCEAIVSQMTSPELALLDTLALTRVQGLTVLWAMKEALSKVLRCGLMLPFSLLEVNRFERSGRHITGWFRHFGQYKAVAIDLGQFCCALALPRETHGLTLGDLAPVFVSPPA